MLVVKIFVYTTGFVHLCVLINLVKYYNFCVPKNSILVNPERPKINISEWPTKFM